MVYYILIGAIAGWAAGQILNGSHFGLIGNVIIGIIGSVIGGWVFNFLGISVENGLTGSLITSIAGAIILLWAVSQAEKGGKKRRR